MENRTFNIGELSESEIGLIFMGLDELPSKLTRKLLNKLEFLVSEQIRMQSNKNDDTSTMDNSNNEDSSNTKSVS